MLTIAGEFFVEVIKVLIVLPCRGGERSVSLRERGRRGRKAYVEKWGGEREGI